MNNLLSLNAVVAGATGSLRGSTSCFSLASHVTNKFSIKIYRNDSYEFAHNGEIYLLTQDPTDPQCQFKSIPAAYITYNSKCGFDNDGQPDSNNMVTEYIIFC
ncbi:hypothetical protein EBR43_07230 [bacterium]|jgi:hypothetical protein|nr:hypothetical protein [bacterium]NBW57561.1 hypothetical protein [bacterium]NBX71953.1 hypothetical protein [bacterium]